MFKCNEESNNQTPKRLESCKNFISPISWLLLSNMHPKGGGAGGFLQVSPRRHHANAYMHLSFPQSRIFKRERARIRGIGKRKAETSANVTPLTQLQDTLFAHYKTTPLQH